MAPSPSQPISRGERGIALALAMFTLVVVGILVAGALFVGTQEQRMGVSGGRLDQALRIAELGAAEVIGSWPVSWGAYDRLRPFPLDTARIPWTPTPNRTGSYGGSVYRLSNTTFLLDITARDNATCAALQRVSVVVRVGPLGTVGLSRSRGWTQLLGVP